MAFDTLMGYMLVFAIVISVIYIIFRRSGVEAKLKKIKERNLEQTRTGWGVEELEKLTELQVKKLLKMSEKVNKKLIVGMRNLGKITKRVKIRKNLYLCEIKKSFMEQIGLKKPIYLIINTNEIIHSDNKTIYLKDKIIFNQFGVYYLVDDKQSVKEKKEYLDFLINKMNYEDVVGRISNLATKVSYLDLTHTQNMEALNKKIEAILKEREGERLSMMDIATA